MSVIGVIAFATAPVPVRAAAMLLLGEASQLSEASEEQRDAYGWAIENYDAAYASFASMKIAGALVGVENIWWHENDANALGSSDLDPAFYLELNDFVVNGGGLFLSGFAVSRVVNLGFEDTAPDVCLADPVTTGDPWGYYQKAYSPFFDGLDATFSTVAQGLPVENVLCWWSDASQFDGTWLADAEWRGNVVTMGEYRPGLGHVVVTATGAYSWYYSGQVNAQRSTLERLTRNILGNLGESIPTELMAQWRFNEVDGATHAFESVSGASCSVLNNFNRPERTSGPDGTALRIDGYSTFVDVPGGIVNASLTGMTVEAWVATRAYPFQNDAAIINQHEAGKGFFLGLDPYGVWNFSLQTNQGWESVFAPDPLPRYEWIHVAGVYGAGDALRLYLNGVEVAASATTSSGLTPAPDASLLIGRHNTFTFHDIFPLGFFNGLVDEARIYSYARSADEILSDAHEYSPPAADIVPPPSRFEGDLLRPVYHPMPPADWTNEPHGLTYWNGNYHLFYQENPNGPYFGNQHWGHIYSPDLIHWTGLPSALWPEADLDPSGSWSGYVIQDGSRVAITYTSNSGGQSQSLAFSDESLLLNWTKAGDNPQTGEFPPGSCAGLLGFRDPFVWRDNGFYYFGVGSGCPDGGGSVELYRAPLADIANWEYRGRLFEGPDAGRMWEMPKFWPIGAGKWCLLVNELNGGPARGRYWIGTWNNATERFTPDFSDGKTYDQGLMLLSPDIGFTPDGRTISIGVLIEDRGPGDFLLSGWANAFGIPLELMLHPDGDKIFYQPAAETQNLRGARSHFEALSVPSGASGFLSSINTGAFEVRAEVNLNGVNQFGIALRRSPDAEEVTRITYTPSSSTLAIERTNSSLNWAVDKSNVSAPHALMAGEPLKLIIFVDRSTIELIANNRTLLATRIYPTRADSIGIDLFSTAGTSIVNSLDIWDMESSEVTIGGAGIVAW